MNRIIPSHLPVNTPASPKGAFQRHVRLGLRIGAAAAFLFASLLALSQPLAPGFAPGRILVQAKAGVTDADFDPVLKAHGGKSIGKLEGLGVHVVTLPPGQSERDTVAWLKTHPNVKFAELDQRVGPAATTNDPLLGSEWHLAKIGAVTAWDTSNGAGSVIAILDSGVDGTHPDLKAQMVAGWNFWDNTSNTSDITGHGTGVAGAAGAASNNGIGVASVAWGARIMPVRVTDSTGYAYWSTVAQGLMWAADRGAHVANISYAVAASSTVQNAAQYMRNKGGIVVVAAGNTGAADATPASNSMIIVSATDQSDARTSWSTYGTMVDLAAPGYYIYSTTRGGGYAYWWGTSLSTPVVAGVAALVKAARPELSAAQIESILFSTAVDLGTGGKDTYFGYGRINAAAAVAAAKAASTSDTTPPSVSIASPTGGTVSGSVTINVNASDNVGVARVDLRINGTVVASDITAPYSFVWNSASVANGSVSVAAAAVDAKQNTRTSNPVTLTVSNATTTTADTTPPAVAILSPANGSKVKNGTVTVAGSASDAGGLSMVTLSIDGAVVASGNSGTINYKWATSRTAPGSHTIKITATDKAGNLRSASVAVMK